MNFTQVNWAGWVILCLQSIGLIATTIAGETLRKRFINLVSASITVWISLVALKII